MERQLEILILDMAGNSDLLEQQKNTLTGYPTNYNFVIIAVDTEEAHSFKIKINTIFATVFTT